MNQKEMLFKPNKVCLNQVESQVDPKSKKNLSCTLKKIYFELFKKDALVNNLKKIFLVNTE